MRPLEERTVPSANLWVTVAGDSGTDEHGIAGSDSTLLDGDLRWCLYTASEINDAVVINFHQSVSAISVNPALGPFLITDRIDNTTDPNFPDAFDHHSITILGRVDPTTSQNLNIISGDAQTSKSTGVFEISFANTSINSVPLDGIISVEFQSIDVAYGYDEKGAGIYAHVDNAGKAEAGRAINLTVSSSNLHHNSATIPVGTTATGLGGGIFFDVPLTTKYNTTFVGSLALNRALLAHNTAKSDGGGIFMRAQGGTLDVSNGSVFDFDEFGMKSNSSDGNGGALYVDVPSAIINGNSQGHALIEGTLFSENSATLSGGAIWSKAELILGLEDSFATSQFEENHADYDGGAIYSKAGRIEVRFEANFLNNSAYGNGGAIRTDEWLNVLHRFHVIGNSAAQNGGGIYVGGGKLEAIDADVNNCPATISFNDAGDSGGGVAAVPGTIVHIKGSPEFDIRVESNTAENDGGGFYIDDATLILGGEARTYIQSNHAENGFGGGVFARGGTRGKGDVHITGVAINDNTAFAGGGGISVSDQGWLETLNKFSIGLGLYQNTATTGGGGGIRLSDVSTDKLKQTTIFSTTIHESVVDADGDGGGILILGSGYIILGNPNAESTQDLIIESCQAPDGDGGGIAIKNFNGASSTVSMTRAYVARELTPQGVLGDPAYAIRGGGIAIVDSTQPVSIEYSHITSCDAKSDATPSAGIGGGLYLEDVGKLSIVDTLIQNNTATAIGGGIAIMGTGDVTMFSTDARRIYDLAQIQGNLASGGESVGVGGGLYVSGSAKLAMIQYKTILNEAGRSGGGFYFQDTTEQIDIGSSTVQLNVARSGPGGGAFLEVAANVLILNSSFDQNSSALGHDVGGGLAITGDSTDPLSVTIALSTITSNAASSGGGIAVFATNAKVSIDSCTIDKNIAEADTATGAGGGGVFISRDSGLDPVVVIKNSTISKNSASDSLGGGILYPHGVAHDSTTTTRSIFNTTIFGNDARHGGGIAVEGDALLTDSPMVFNCTIANNTAHGDDSDPLNVIDGKGGGVFFRGFGSNEHLRLDSTIVAFNNASDGTDVRSDSGELLFWHSLIREADQLSDFTLALGPSSSPLIGDAASPVDPGFKMTDPDTPELGYFGGATRTVSLLPYDSNLPAEHQAIDAGWNTLDLDYDQRDNPFNRTVSSGKALQVDIGAFEFQSPKASPIQGIILDNGPAIPSQSVNDTQRSMVKRMIVTFNYLVYFNGDVTTAFTLFRNGDHSTQQPGVSGTVTLTASPSTGLMSSVTFTFSGSFTEDAPPNWIYRSLVDGFYDLSIDLDASAGTGVWAAITPTVGDTANKFFRLFGDADGNGTVGLGEFAAFSSVFNLGPNQIFDMGQDGNVGLDDFAAFRSRFNLTP